MNVLTVKKLKKIYPAKKNFWGKVIAKEFNAVNDISFDLRKGEILGFLGTNGAGKTTTMQMLLSILTPTSGEIRYFDRDFLQNRSEVLKKVGFASTYVQLPSDISLKNGLLYFANLYGLSGKEADDAVEKNLEYFKLQHLESKKACMLSAGESARAMLAKAFLANPSVVILDEPTAALDPDSACQVRRFIREKKEREQVSFLFTSHNMTEVEELCDRILVLKEGKIIANKTPEELAMTVSQTTVHLLLDKIAKSIFEDIAKSKKLNYLFDGGFVRITISENNISELLYELAIKNVKYLSIFIDKPKLENYFLTLNKKI